jgi:hypothetical protein
MTPTDRQQAIYDEYSIVYATAMQTKVKWRREELLREADLILCTEFDAVLNGTQEESMQLPETEAEYIATLEAEGYTVTISKPGDYHQVVVTRDGQVVTDCYSHHSQFDAVINAHNRTPIREGETTPNDTHPTT